MSIPTTTNTAASSGPLLLLVVIVVIVMIILAVTLLKRNSAQQATQRAAQTGEALGFTPVAGASVDEPPAGLATLQTLTHGRSHRFAHVMQSAEGGVLFQISYDTGILHRPSRWSYAAYALPVNAGGATVLVVPASGPEDVAAELGFVDLTIAGRTVRTSDADDARSRFDTPEIQAWLTAYPELFVELGGGYLTVMTPGDIEASDGDTDAADLPRLIEAHEKLVALLITS